MTHFPDQHPVDPGQMWTLPPAPPDPKPRLHWFQWIVYTAVLVFCVVGVFALLEVWIFVDNLSEALHELCERWSGTTC